ncbi:MAG: arginase [Deltaproteobacteria bacterium]|nr:arginase [Deltaproteobacteria bacterium]
MNHSSTKYGLLGFPSDIGATVSGSKEGPRVLREHGLIDILRRVVPDVHDYGDITLGDTPNDGIFSAEERTIRNLHDVYRADKALCEATKKVLEDGRTPIILGGDHSLSLGSISGVSNFYARHAENVGVIWVDAHPDINTPATSPSGNLFGMPLAFLGGLVPGAFQKLSDRDKAIDFKNLAFIALRDVDEGERSLIRERGITAFSMRDVDLRGMGAVVNDAIRVATAGTKGFVLSFDLDACDPLLAPGTGTPYRGGLTFRESHLLMELIAESRKLLSLELVEFNPLLDKGGQTVEIAISLLETALGRTIL